MGRSRTSCQSVFSRAEEVRRVWSEIGKRYASRLGQLHRFLAVLRIQFPHLSIVNEMLEQLNHSLFVQSIVFVSTDILGGIVKCCVLRSFSSDGFLQDSVFEGTSFDDECDLFVAA